MYIGDIIADIQCIKEGINELSKKMDTLFEQRDTLGMMHLSDKSLASFLEDEPDLYAIEDCKVVYQ